jgi:hypothetical protein
MNDLLDGHAALDLECQDLLYLHGCCCVTPYGDATTHILNTTGTEILWPVATGAQNILI